MTTPNDDLQTLLRPLDPRTRDRVLRVIANFPTHAHVNNLIADQISPLRHHLTKLQLDNDELRQRVYALEERLSRLAER